MNAKIEHPQKHKFNLAYANLPLIERKQVCCVVDGEPMSWYIVWQELENGTEIGDKALEQLVRIGVIQ